MHLRTCLQTLYESSIAFGMRKALQTEAGKSDMEQRIATLEVEAKDLERQVGQPMSAKLEGSDSGSINLSLLPSLHTAKPQGCAA